MGIVSARNHSIAVILFDNFMSLDVTGPVDVFMAANEFWKHEHDLPADYRYYQYEMISAENSEVRASSDISFLTKHTIRDTDPSSYDAVLVPGGKGVEEAEKNQDLLDWIAEAHKNSIRTISVCSGSWLLAKAGTLEGKNCATHWRICRALSKHFPGVMVDEDSLYVADGKVISSAGVTSGIDMALALVEADMGRTIALDVARRLVVHLKRSGNQSQFSGPLKAQTAASCDNIGRVVPWILENLDRPLNVETMAERAGMSVRSFSRHFKNELGDTPAKFIEQARLENARMLLDENTKIALPQAAAASGFSSVEHLTRAFERRFGVHPNAYREAFALN